MTTPPDPDEPTADEIDRGLYIDLGDGVTENLAAWVDQMDTTFGLDRLTDHAQQLVDIAGISTLDHPDALEAIGLRDTNDALSAFVDRIGLADVVLPDAGFEAMNAALGRDRISDHAQQIIDVAAPTLDDVAASLADHDLLFDSVDRTGLADVLAHDPITLMPDVAAETMTAIADHIGELGDPSAHIFGRAGLDEITSGLTAGVHTDHASLHEALKIDMPAALSGFAGTDRIDSLAPLDDLVPVLERDTSGRDAAIETAQHVARLVQLAQAQQAVVERQAETIDTLTERLKRDSAAHSRQNRSMIGIALIGVVITAVSVWLAFNAAQPARPAEDPPAIATPTG